MSTDANPAAAVLGGTSATIRYWRQSLLWTGIGMLACFAAFCVEKYGLQLALRDLPRVFYNPAEISMRIFGIPHYIVGLLFLLTARRMRTVAGWVWFLALLAIGAVATRTFYLLGAHENPVLLIAFYFYFLIHAFRDESFFYQTCGDCPAANPVANKRVLVGLQVILLSLLFAFLMPTHLQYLKIRDRLPTGDPVLDLFFPASWPFLVKFVTYLIPALIVSVGIAWALNRDYPGGWRAIRRDHRPILTIFTVSGLIILATLVVGPWTFNFVVLAHFVAWYLFALRKLKRVPAEKRAGISHPLSWVRTTTTGFRTLHLGLAAIVAALIMVSVYVFERGDVLQYALGRPAFYYGAVMHVTLSFYPR